MKLPLRPLGPWGGGLGEGSLDQGQAGPRMTESVPRARLKLHARPLGPLEGGFGGETAAAGLGEARDDGKRAFSVIEVVVQASA